MFFLIIVSLFGSIFAECPPGSEYIQQLDKCLAVVKNGTKYGFFDAEFACRARGGHLSSIHNGFENSVMKNVALRDNLVTNSYIGATLSDGRWIWTDGTAMTYTNWAPGQPNGQNDCTTLSVKDGKWYTTSCVQDNVPFFCLLEQMGTTSPSTSPAPTTPATPCPFEWIQFKDNCYLFNNTRNTQQFLGWFEARDFCRLRGGDLASIHSQEENMFIATANTECWFPWIGLQWNDSYSWSDGSTVDFNNATRHERYPPAVYYMYQSGCDAAMTGWWDDYTTLYVNSAFVCKKPAQPIGSA